MPSESVTTLHFEAKLCRFPLLYRFNRSIQNYSSHRQVASYISLVSSKRLLSEKKKAIEQKMDYVLLEMPLLPAVTKETKTRLQMYKNQEDMQLIPD